jgi:hypothetical protein
MDAVLFLYGAVAFTPYSTELSLEAQIKAFSAELRAGAAAGAPDHLLLRLINTLCVLFMISMLNSFARLVALAEQGKLGPHQAPASPAPADPATAERAAAERAAAARATARRVLADWVPAGWALDGWATTDWAPADQALADQAPDSRAPDSRALADQASVPVQAERAATRQIAHVTTGTSHRHRPIHAREAFAPTGARGEPRHRSLDQGFTGRLSKIAAGGVRLSTP